MLCEPPKLSILYVDCSEPHVDHLIDSCIVNWSIDRGVLMKSEPYEFAHSQMKTIGLFDSMTF
jgi:hypothetical protein